MRLQIVLSSLLLAGVMSVGVSAAPAPTVVRSSVATPTLVPTCPPKGCEY